VLGPDGAIWLWNDKGEMRAISVAEDLVGAEAAFQPCAHCHNADDASGKLGPALLESFNAPVASKPDFEYSKALKAVGGQWTAERLDAFLADPAKFAPGTRMTFKVTDRGQRAAVIEYLREIGRMGLRAQ